MNMSYLQSSEYNGKFKRRQNGLDNYLHSIYVVAIAMTLLQLKVEKI